MTAQQELDAIKHEYFALRAAFEERPNLENRRAFERMRNTVVTLRSEIKREQKAL